MLDINLTTIIFQVLNFAVLFAALYFLLFKNIVKRAENRKIELEELRQKTIQNFEESDKLRQQLEESLKNIHLKVDEYISKAKAELELNRYQVLEDTKAMAEQIIRQAQANASTIQVRAIEENQERMMNLIIDLVANVIKQSAPEEFHHSLVEQINNRVWEMGKREMREVDLVRKSLQEREPTLSIKTPLPLTKEQQAAIVRTFSSLADKNVKLQISKDESLIAGVSIRLGDFIIDNSVKSKLQEIKKEAMEDFIRKIQEMRAA